MLKREIEILGKLIILLTLLHRGISSCKAFIFSLILSRRLCMKMQYDTSENEESRIKFKDSLKLCKYTLSERLWTSAARDLLVDVEPRPCFLASGDS